MDNTAVKTGLGNLLSLRKFEHRLSWTGSLSKPHNDRAAEAKPFQSRVNGLILQCFE